MWLVIAGGVVVGAVGLAAIYDYVAGRRGRNTSLGSSGGSASSTAQSERNSLLP